MDKSNIFEIIFYEKYIKKRAIVQQKLRKRIKCVMIEYGSAFVFLHFLKKNKQFLIRKFVEGSLDLYGSQKCIKAVCAVCHGWTAWTIAPYATSDLSFRMLPDG